MLTFFFLLAIDVHSILQMTTIVGYEGTAFILLLHKMHRINYGVNSVNTVGSNKSRRKLKVLGVEIDVYGDEIEPEDSSHVMIEDNFDPEMTPEHMKKLINKQADMLKNVLVAHSSEVV